MVRRWIVRLLVAVAILALAVATLVPMPHGPPLLFQLVSQTWRDLGESWQSRQQQSDERASFDDGREVFYQAFDGRFAGALDYAGTDDLGGGWQLVSVSGVTALLDGNSGMIYSTEIGPALGGWTADDLAAATARCRALMPQGYWDIPTGREMDMAYENGILQADAASSQRWIVRIVSYGGHDGPGLKAWSSGSDVAVRCIARSAKAPPHGYLRGDRGY